MNRIRTVVVAASRVLLGAFVLVQVVYLLASLLFNMEGAFRSLVDIRWLRAWNEREVNGFRQYGQATAQRQRWQLFAPDAWNEIEFLELELSWDDPAWKSVTLRADCEPADFNAFVHVGGFRIREYETNNLPAKGGTVLFGEKDEFKAEEDELPAAMVYPDTSEKILTYLRWRLASFRREHPERPPPSEVQLFLHTYRIPEPPGRDPWRWEDRGVTYVGRWLP